MPGIFHYIFSFLIFNNHKDAVLGDYEELYNYMKIDEGRLKALWWLSFQVGLLIPDYFRNSMSWGAYMFGNYFKIGLRTVLNDKLHSTINILGLSIGISVSVILLIYLHSEIAYDTFHNDSENIYRVYTISQNSDNTESQVALTMGQFTGALNKTSGIEGSTKLFKYGKVNCKIDDKIISDVKTFTANEGFFDVFSFKILHKNNNELLTEPNKVILTAETSIKIFGTENSLGRVFQFSKKDYMVEAIVENIPANSHFTFDMLLSHCSVPFLEGLTSNEFYTYFKITDGRNHDYVLSQAYKNCNEHLAARLSKGYIGYPGFQALEDIHLNSSHFDFKIAEHGNKKLIYILLILASSILIIAMLNFINLLTARSQNRFKEIAVRRVIGADKSSVLIQYISESLVISIIATIFGSIIIYFSLGEAKSLLGTILNSYYEYYPFIVLVIMFLSFSVGIIASIYPSIIVSGFAPSKILRNKNNIKSNKSLISFTVLVQFTIVVIMMISVFVIYDQVNFLKDQDLGFKKEQILSFQIDKAGDYQTIKTELINTEGIIAVTGSQSIPGRIRSGQMGRIVEFASDKIIDIKENRIQDDYIKTYGMKLLKGRDFYNTIEHEPNSVIINESAVKALGATLDNVVGKHLIYLEPEMEIIGVVADFNFTSLHNKIEPLIFSRYSERSYVISVRITGRNISSTINKIKNVVKEIEPGLIFNYKFLDDRFAEMYEKEENQYSIIFTASLIAIIISVLGLFALTSFSVVKRTKEIGLRKVMGASVPTIVFLLLKDFSKYILISILIAWPIAYFLLRSWLENFAYQIELGAIHFVSSAVITMLVAFLTVIYLTTKAAVQNPVDSIRCE